MSSLTSSSSNLKCLVCLSLFKSERCKNPEYFTAVFDVFCHLLGIDSIEPIRWNFNQHGIPFCEVCCPAVEKLKGLNDQFDVHKPQINNILHIIKQNILKSENISNSLAKDVNLTLINRVHSFHSQIPQGSSHLDSNDTEDEDVNPSNIGQFLKVEIESDNDEAPVSYPDPIRKNDPLVEQAENEPHFRTASVIQGELSTLKKNKDPDSLFLDRNDCDSSLQSSSITTSNSITASVIPEASFNESELIIIKPEIIDNYNSDYADTEENSFQGVVVEDVESIFRDQNNVSRVETSASESDSEINTDSHGSIVGEKNVPPSSRRHKCEYCGKMIAKRGHLVRHTRIHTGEKPYKCEICGKAFTHSWTLVNHARIHTGDKPFKCEFCNKSFRISTALTKHSKLHSGGKPFQCEFCEKRFGTSRDLKLHRRTHTGDLPNECEVCQKTFTRACDLRRHKLIHTGKKPFQCDICNKAFGRLSNFERHKKIHTKTKVK